MHILILENGRNIDKLVWALKQNPNTGLIFASQDAICTIDDVTKIEFESDEIEEIVDFVEANAIDFVFALSNKAQSSEILDLLSMKDIGVFGSSQQQYEYLLSRANTKKLIYKNKIPTLKFAVFEKQNMATQWCKTAQYPILIMSDMKDEIKQYFYVDTNLKAQHIIDDLFEQGFEKVIAQQVVEGHYFSSYYLTDSMSHVHLANFYRENDLTICPDFQVSPQMQSAIFDDYFLKILNAINYNAQPFCGVLKLDFVLTNDGLYLIDTGANFNNVDFQLLLDILDTDICNLFSSLANGTLEDFEGSSLLKDNYIAGLKTTEKQPFFEEEDNIETVEIKNGEYLYISEGSTVNRACEYLLNEV